jgi:hypothetical protein
MKISSSKMKYYGLMRHDWETCDYAYNYGIIFLVDEESQKVYICDITTQDGKLVASMMKPDIFIYFSINVARTSYRRYYENGCRPIDKFPPCVVECINRFHHERK